MEAIILCGGGGTRLRPVLADRPKALAPINGTPFLHLLLQMLRAGGFERIILATGYLAEQISEITGPEFAGMEIVYSREISPLGTGGAVAKACAKCISDIVFIMNGDTWLNMDFRAAARLCRATDNLALSCLRVQDASRFGAVSLSGGKINALHEKGVSGPGWINAGCYVAPAAVLERLPKGKPFSFERDFLEKRLPVQPAEFHEAKGPFFDIGTPASYAEFIAYCATGRT